MGEEAKSRPMSVPWDHDDHRPLGELSPEEQAAWNNVGPAIQSGETFSEDLLRRARELGVIARDDSNQGVPHAT